VGTRAQRRTMNTSSRVECEAIRNRGGKHNIVSASCRGMLRPETGRSKSEKRKGGIEYRIPEKVEPRGKKPPKKIDKVTEKKVRGTGNRTQVTSEKRETTNRRSWLKSRHLRRKKKTRG